MVEQRKQIHHDPKLKSSGRLLTYVSVFGGGVGGFIYVPLFTVQVEGVRALV